MSKTYVSKILYTIRGKKMLKIKIIDFFCKIFGLPVYSITRKYAPVEYMYKLDDNPNNVYVWQLRKDIDENKYALRIAKRLGKVGKDLKAIHIYTTNVDKIIKLDPDLVKMLIEHNYSDDATKGGKKQ